MTRVPKDRAEALQFLREDRIANPMPLMPCADQTPEDIAAYYKTAEPGAVVVVRQGYGGMLTYHVGTVTDANPKRGRIYVQAGHSGGAAFYTKHGKNCFEPTGQTRLVVPTPEVLAWAEAHPRGEFGFTIHRGKEHGPAPER